MPLTSEYICLKSMNRPMDIINRHHTIEIADTRIRSPNIAAKPNKKTAKCNSMYAFEILFIGHEDSACLKERT